MPTPGVADTGNPHPVLYPVPLRNRHYNQRTSYQIKAVTNKQKHRRLKRKVNWKAVDASDVIRKENTHTQRKPQLEQLTSEVMRNMAQRGIKHKRNFAVLTASDIDRFSHNIYSSPPQRNQTEVVQTVPTL